MILDYRLILQNSTLFKALPIEGRRYFENHMRIVTIKRGKLLFKEWDTSNGIYVLLNGVLKISRITREENEIFLAILVKGDLVGEVSLLDRKPRSATATGLSDCSLANLPQQQFEIVLNQYPELYRQLLNSMCNRLRQTNQRIEINEFSATERLAELFKRLAYATGEPLPDGQTIIKLKISQAELGTLTSLSREMVNRILKKWRTKKLLSVISGYFVITNIEKMYSENIKND